MNHPIFSKVNILGIKLIMKGGSIGNYQKKKVIYIEGEKNEKVCFILQGQVALQHS